MILRNIFVLVAAGCLTLTAQTLSLVPPANPAQGTNHLIVRFTSGVAPIAALQWDLTASTTVQTAESLVPGKQAACNMAAVRCLLFGVNQDAITTGDVARIPFNIPGPGQFSFRLTNVVASGPSGEAVSIIAGPEVTVTVRDPFDLDGDGSVNGSDLGVVISQILGSCGTADLNKDGTCNVRDVMVMVARLLQTAPPVAEVPSIENLIASTQPKAHPEPSNTIIVANDNTRAETGTNGKGASLSCSIDSFEARPSVRRSIAPRQLSGAATWYFLETEDTVCLRCSKNFAIR